MSSLWCPKLAEHRFSAPTAVPNLIFPLRRLKKESSTTCDAQPFPSLVLCKTCEIEGPHNNLKTLTVSFKTLTPPTLSPLQEIPANYQFRWDVLDGYTGNDFGQEEAR